MYSVHIFSPFSINSCVLFADKLFMQTYSREHASLRKSILEAHLFRCFFSVYFPQANSINIYTPLRKASGAFIQICFPLFEEPHLVTTFLSSFISCTTFLSPACIHTSSYIFMCLPNLFPFLQPVSLILTLPG